MLYLASQFVWFLLAAFGLGLAMGWISNDGGKPRLWSGAWTVLALLWAGGAALTWFQWLNGMAATWVEFALLFVAAYWIGCVCASLVPRRMAAETAPVAAQKSMPSLPIPPSAAVAEPSVAKPAGALAPASERGRTARPAPVRPPDGPQRQGRRSQVDQGCRPPERGSAAWPRHLAFRADRRLDR